MTEDWAKGLSPKDGIVRLLTNLKHAKKMIEKYEWLGHLGGSTKYAYGIWFNKPGVGEVLGGVECFQLPPTPSCARAVMGKGFSPGYKERMKARKGKVWQEFDKEHYAWDRVLVLGRGACAEWTPKNTASRMIKVACKILGKTSRYRCIIAFADMRQER